MRGSPLPSAPADFPRWWAIWSPAPEWVKKSTGNDWEFQGYVHGTSADADGYRENFLKRALKWIVVEAT